AQAEPVRKMIVAMSRDVRVLLIQLADRLHNARTWKHVPAASAERKAKETPEIYAPPAHPPRPHTMKSELEHRSLQVLYPKVYEEIVSLVAQHAPAREQYLSTVSTQINDDLRKAKIKAEVTGRPKHYYSIYQKMIVRAGTSPTSTTSSGCVCWWTPSGTATACWAPCMPAGRRCRGASRTTSRCRSSTSTSRCTPP